MLNYICAMCGNQYAASEQAPSNCPICEDERQYVNPDGQQWTTLDVLRTKYHNELRPLEPNLTEIFTIPKFGIGQRALLVQAAAGNVLWDCISLIDDATHQAVSALGGLSALTFSHPHMFGSMVAWSHAFGKAPIYLHRDLQRWVQRPDPVIEFWDGESLRLSEGLTLYRCGGHFKGSTVLHWAAGAGGRGALLSSDTIFVTPDRRYTGFMYSYPNYIPLSPTAVDKIVGVVQPLAFEHMYGNFVNLNITADAKGAVQRSAERHKWAVRAA
jgi:hypothetical protein